MNRNEFVEKYVEFMKCALDRAQQARREGILTLENGLDKDKVSERDIFEYGMRFAVDGIDPLIIDQILTNIVAQEKDEYARLLKVIQAAAVLEIQQGSHPQILFYKLNSYTDMSLKDDPAAAELSKRGLL